MPKRRKRRQIASVQLDFYTDGIKDAIPALLNQAMGAGAQNILDVATSKVPVNTGTLRDSGYVATKSKSTYSQHPTHRKEARPTKDGEAVVGFAAFYAHYLEHGTAKLAAKPFLRPAVDEKRAEVGKVVASIVTKGLED